MNRQIVYVFNPGQTFIQRQKQNQFQKVITYYYQRLIMVSIHFLYITHKGQIQELKLYERYNNNLK